MRDHISVSHELMEIAREYHRRCEAYDQTVCRARSARGVAVPVTAEERTLVAKNAAAVRQELAFTKAIKIGASPDELWFAIGKASEEPGFRS